MGKTASLTGDCDPMEKPHRNACLHPSCDNRHRNLSRVDEPRYTGASMWAASASFTTSNFLGEFQQARNRRAFPTSNQGIAQ